jgi:hypothetical protein
MRSPFARVLKRSVRAGSNIVSQVIVSVAAAVCVGFITNAYLERKPAPEQFVASIPAAEQTAVASSGNGAVRIVAAPMTSSTGRPARPLPASAVSMIRNPVEAPVPIVKDPAAEVAADGEDAVPPGASLPPLPSEIVTDRPVRAVDALGAEMFPGVPAESTLAESLRNPTPTAGPKRERRRFLGLPLPYVPSASELLGSATTAGGRIVTIVER